MAFLIFRVKTAGSIIKVSFKNEPVKLLWNDKDNFFKKLFCQQKALFIPEITEWVKLEGIVKGVSWSNIPTPSGSF